MKQNRDDVSLNLFDLVDNVCKKFRAERKAGKTPRLEDWIGKVPEKAQPNLFRNLLDTEIKLRQRLGQSPTSSEYLKRFPQFSSQIRQVFDESTMGSVEEGIPQAADHSASSENLTQTFDGPAANRLGDYELIRELGRGGMGVVYEARHRETGNQVALKTLPTGGHGQEVNADKLYRFRKEFRRLSEINHPNLVGMQTLEVDGDQWFFTMDVIDGTDFLSYVRPGDQLDESRLRNALEQLARGVLALHRRGIIHRDLKPSNVLVADDGTVSILDFGLASEMQLATDMTQTRSGMFAGTPRYAAPEQMFGERTEASDWYALGTMLYEALTGAPPFTGPGHVELLRQKQYEEPARLSEQQDLPADLAQLADGLIPREPDQRMTVESIGQYLNLEEETRTAGSTQASRGSEPSGGSSDSTGSIDDATVDFSDSESEAELVLIGRDSQLAELEQARQQMVETGKPVLVWVSGLSGEGKSSLCETFLRPLREGTEMLVLAGRCYDRESVPFKAVDSIVESLVRYLRSRHGKWLEAEQPEDVEFLAAIFPLFRRVDWIAGRKIQDLSRTEPQKIRGRAFYGFRQLLTAIAQRTPVVIHLDDLQWGDADSARAWQELLVHQEAPPLLVLGGYRSDEAADSPFWQTWKQVEQSAFHKLETRTVSVSALTQEQCFQLVRQRTGLTTEEMQAQVRQLFAETAGNPYFLDQLLEGFDPTTNTFRHVPLDEIIASRLSRLPKSAARLLEVIAISGQPIRIDEVSAVAEAGKTASATLTHMRSERLVRLMGSGSDALVETWHDKVRESVRASLDLAWKKQLHLSLAEEIENKQEKKADEWLESLASISTPGENEFAPPARVLDLCQHFMQAEDKRAFIYLWLAAEQAMNAYAVDEAYDLFQQARSMLPANESSALQYRFWMGLGHVCLWHKAADQAIKAYKRAADEASEPIETAEAYAGLQAVNMQTASFDEANRWMDLALQELKVKSPQSSIGRSIWFIRKNLRLLFVPESWQVAKTELQRQYAGLAQRIFTIANMGLLEKSLGRAAENCTQAALAGIKTGEYSRSAMGLALVAGVWSSLGLRLIARSLLKRVYYRKTDFDDPQLTGLERFFSAFPEYSAGNIKVAEELYEQAIPLLGRCSRFDELQNGVHMQRHIINYLGDSKRELSKAREVLELAEATGNAQAICWGCYDIASALARAGENAAAVGYMQRANLVLPNEEYFMTLAIRASTDAYVRLQCSDYETAGGLTDFGWAIIRKGWMMLDVTLLFIPLALESMSGAAWHRLLRPVERKALKKWLRRAKLLYVIMPNHQPHLHRVFGRAYWRLGKNRKAIKNFEKAIQLSEQKGMKYQQGKSLLDLAAVKEEGREQNRATGIELLKKMKSVIPRAESWLLGDQYDEAVVAPEFDLAAWEAENGPVTPYLNDLEKAK